MKKTTSTGVFQLPNSAWGFRYAYWIDGKQKDIKRTKDENGNPFKTEKAAMKARESAIIRAQSELSQPQKSPKKRATVAEVFTEYCETGRCGADCSDRRQRQWHYWGYSPLRWPFQDRSAPYTGQMRDSVARFRIFPDLW